MAARNTPPPQNEPTEESYFLIVGCNHSDAKIFRMTKPELEEALRDRRTPDGEDLENSDRLEFLETSPWSGNNHHILDGEILIIKGRVVVPTFQPVFD